MTYQHDKCLWRKGVLSGLMLLGLLLAAGCRGQRDATDERSAGRDPSASSTASTSKTATKSETVELDPEAFARDFAEFVAAPSGERYLTMLRQLVRSSRFSSHSGRLQEIKQLFDKGQPEDALKLSEEARIPLMLSPRLWHLRAIILSGMERTSEMESDFKRYRACLQGILETGDGSIDKPYFVTHVADEDEILSELKLRTASQGVLEHEGRQLDLFELVDGHTIYFDVTDIVNQ